MADPKYANLPGLAPDDEPDTFETDDRPEVDQDIDYEESDAVEQLDVSTADAFNTFKNKSLDGRGADFSDRLRLARHTGYAAGGAGHWELAGAGQPETLLQRYQRLQMEVQQLDQQVAELQQSSKKSSAGGGRGDAEKEEPAAVERVGADAGRLQRHLHDMNLEQLLGAEVLSALSDPQGTLRSKLELQLSQLASPAAAGQPSPRAGGAGEAASYELHVRPSAAPAAASSGGGQQLAALESRLQAIELAVGAAPDKMSRLASETRHQSLLAAVASLSSKVALLEPAALEAAEARLQALHQRMNQVAENRPETGVPAEKLNTIGELYQLMQDSAELQTQMPHVLERLESLQSLHDQSLNFSRALTELESSQQKMESELSEAESQLSQRQAEVSAALAALQGGLETLNARLDAAAAGQKK